ncbi:MAG: hypothetical protein L0Z49_10245 [Actinobacteria bacterium]|nr:hypothetical protein [Actinomycetota bacterium]MCI0544807.1 hypothetical protein [Actinomycetota bacterium]MCI0678297.1 hypothetical protein [Actinomycetota bacterium]
MIRGVEIKGGAGEFEAAVIAVVLDHIAREREAARQGRRPSGPELPAWVRATAPQTPADHPVTHP